MGETKMTSKKLLENYLRKVIRTEIRRLSENSNKPKAQKGDPIAVYDWRSKKTFTAIVTYIKFDGDFEQWVVGYKLPDNALHYSGESEHYAIYDSTTGKYEDGEI